MLYTDRLVLIAIPTKPNGGNHTALFTEAARTMEAHEVTLTVIKGLALTGVRVINDDAYFAQVCYSSCRNVIEI
jgi:hypothetical protein